MLFPGSRLGIMQVYIAQEHTDTAPLEGTTLNCLHCAIRPQDSGFELPAHARQHPGIPNSQLHEPHGLRMVQTAKEVAKVGLQNKTDLLSCNDFVQRGQGVVSTPSGSALKRAVEEIRLIDEWRFLVSK